MLFMLLLIFVGHTLLSTGFFRSIEPLFDGKILERIAVKGAEDIKISQNDSFALISSTNRIVYPPEAEEKGGLFLIDLKTDDFTTIPLTVAFNQSFAPHGISFFKKDSSYKVMAINYTSKGHSIEVFELQDNEMSHIKILRLPSKIRPNDIVIVS
jgi:arylesterase/paraoxonase